MMNMGYCRFKNTNLALQECLCAIEDGTIQSHREAAEGKNMFGRFLEFCEDNGIISDFDREEIDVLLDTAVEEDEDEDEDE